MSSHPDPGGPAVVNEHHQGCLLCGARLAYRTIAEPVVCSLCGAAGSSPVACQAGHFVCDTCHAAPAREVIERVCLASDSTDPVALAAMLMRHESLKLHGPEHHYLVPAVLLAAFANAGGKAEDKARMLAEARRRADSVLGGFCGFQGACGAGVGVGIFVSVATGATPLARQAWGTANSATGSALAVIGRLGGPRCCKRTTLLAILTGIRVARESLGVRLDGRGVACEWSEQNAECLDRACPFHPERRSDKRPGDGETGAGSRDHRLEVDKHIPMSADRRDTAQRNAFSVTSAES